MAFDFSDALWRISARAQVGGRDHRGNVRPPPQVGCRGHTGLRGHDGLREMLPMQPSTSVLQAVVTRKAKSPHLNLVILEIQLELGATMYDLTAAHFWSEENEIADALSRLPEGVAIPAALAKAERTPSTRRRKWRFLGQVPRDG